MAIENEVAKTPREHFDRDTDDGLPKFKERTLQRPARRISKVRRRSGTQNADNFADGVG